MSKSIFNFLKITLIVSAVIYLIDQGSGWINGVAIGSLSSELKMFSIYFLYAFLIGGANVYLITVLDKRISWKKAPKRRLIVGLLGSILVSLHAVGLVRLIVNFINGYSVAYFIEHERAINYFYALLITLVIVLFFHAYYFYKALFEKKVEASEFEAKTESAKYESLKSQLDPHFLFNSLNVLTALIGEDPTKAERFTTKLSKVYRYVLEQKEKDLIPLQEELNFAKTYMELLKMRFEDAVVFDLPKTLSNPNFKIAPLTLQILLENAVKHNVISKENPLTISITIEGNVLLVNNKSHKKSTLKKSTHVGLKNIIERYALVTNRKIEIIEKEGYFRVKIPLLTKKIKIMETDIKINEKYLRAQKRVKEIKEFYSGLLSYIIVIPFLYYIWHTFTPFTIQWFWFPAFGWGIGLVFHAAKAFNFAPILGHNWEERKLKEFMKEDEKEYWK